MPMNPIVLTSLIKAKVEAATGVPMPDVGEAVWQAVAAAIIEHIVSAGVVTVAVTTTGSATNQAGTGIGKML